MKKLFLALLSISYAISSSAVTNINGAGATFPYPIYSHWFFEYQKTNKNVRFNYQAIGSGGGVRQLVNGTVDFGASDVPMKDQDIDKIYKNRSSKVIHIPTVLGAVTLAYNLKGVSNLKLDGKTIANMFLNRIKKWNHPSIIAQNKRIKLPNKNIISVHRSDGSGTTAIFSKFLAKSSQNWKDEVGVGKSLRWKGGIGAKGNDGVTAQIKLNEGAIGYIELSYAMKNKLETAYIKNGVGEYIKPTIKTILKSAKKLTPQNLKKGVISAKIKGSYPISSPTFILLQNKTKTKNALMELRKFLVWALKDGQKYASDLYYAPLPKIVAKNYIKIVKSFE